MDIVEFMKRQNRDKRSQTDKGCYPSISLNNRDLVVEINHQTGTNLMFYRVGQVKDDVIVWGNPSSAKPPKKRYFCSGSYPRVTLNDKNTVIEMHKGQFLDRICYRVGNIDLTKMKIAWGPSTHVNAGLYPDVATNNNDTVVAVFQDNIFTKHPYYRVGQVNGETKEIEWTLKKKQRIAGVMAEVLSVDINDNDLVILSYQVPVINHVHYLFGKLSMPSGVIEWSRIKHMCFGFTPSISINNHNQVLQIHQSLMKRHLISNVGVARWEGTCRKIEWSSLEGSSNRYYSNGIFPSVAMNESGYVVEVHEPRTAMHRNRLYYLVGKVSLTGTTVEPPNKGQFGTSHF